MDKKITPIIIIVLLAATLIFGYGFFSQQKELSQCQGESNVQQINIKALDFTKLFIAKVLRANKEVDFDTRLQLENSVRGLKDQAILDQWSKFINSKTETEAQNEVKNLLEKLVNKIQIQ